MSVSTRMLCQLQVVLCLYSRGLIRFHILHSVCTVGVFFKHLWMPRATMDAAEREGLQAPAAWVGLGELPDDLPPDFRTAEFPNIRIHPDQLFHDSSIYFIWTSASRWWDDEKSCGPAWDYGCEQCWRPSITKMMHCSFTWFWFSIFLMLGLKTVLISPKKIEESQRAMETNLALLWKLPLPCLAPQEFTAVGTFGQRQINFAEGLAKEAVSRLHWTFAFWKQWNLLWRNQHANILVRGKTWLTLKRGKLSDRIGT